MKIDVAKWDDLTSDPNGLWYASDEIWPMIEGLFVNPPNQLDDDQRKLKNEVLDYFEPRLAEGQVVLGTREEFFNDDDRWTSDGWKVPIDTVVIHHTVTDPLFQATRLDALHLLRLYCNLYKNSKAFQSDGQLLPISSGHFYMGRQTFVGYHWIVYNEGIFAGETMQLLENRYTGFHAGHYATNCRSIGIAIVDDLTDKLPSPKALRTIRTVINWYPEVKTIIGHKEVKEGTVCPGNRWDEWKGLLFPNR